MHHCVCDGEHENVYIATFVIAFNLCSQRRTNTTSIPHYSDIIMGTIASRSASLTIKFSTVYSDVDQRKHQSSGSLAFVRGIHRDKWPVTRKMFPFDDVVMSMAYLDLDPVMHIHFAPYRHDLSPFCERLDVTAMIRGELRLLPHRKLTDNDGICTEELWW